MAITREEAIAELARRRGASASNPIAQQRPVTPQITKEQAMVELARRRGLNQTASQQQPQQSNIYETPYLGKAASALTGFEKKMGGIGSGILQMLGAKDLAKSVNDYWSQQHQKSSEINPFSTGVGSVTGEIVPMLAAGGVLSKAPLIGSAMSKVPALLQPTVGGGLAGGLSGAVNYVPEGESRAGNAAKQAAEGALLANIIPGAKGAANLAKGQYAKYFSKLPSAEKITTNIAEHVPNKLKVNAGNLYEEAFEEAENTGANQALLKETNVAPLLKRLRLPKEEKRLIKKAYKTKDLRDVHKVDKLLGNRIAELEKKGKTRGFLNERDKTALKVARNAKNNMRSGLEKAFGSASPEAKKSFKQANDTWKQYLDYKQNPIIKKYLKKSPTGKPGLTAEDFIKKASRNETFKSILAERHPEIERYKTRAATKEYLKDKAKQALGWGTLGYGAHKLWD